MRVPMKVVTQHQWMWGAGKKRPAEESMQESSRKRTKDEDSTMSESIGTGHPIGIGVDQEYKIRGTSSNNNNQKDEDVSHSLSPRRNRLASSPIATESLPSPSPPSIHPDRLAHIFNSAPTLTPASSSLQTDSDPLPTPLSTSPEHVNMMETEDQTSRSLHSISHPNLHIDTVRTSSSLNPISPDYTPVMSSRSNEKSGDSPGHDPRNASNSRYGPNSNLSSRRQSDIMPPPNLAKITRSLTSTPKATTPPVNTEFGRRPPSTVQAQVPFAELFNSWAQSITSGASLAVRRDLTKHQAVGQQRERDRQSKFKDTFLTLVEDAESKVEGFEKVSMEIDKQIDLNSQAQSQIAITLAAQLQKEAEISTALSSTQDRARHKGDLADMKAVFETTKKEVDTTRDRGRFNEKLTGMKTDLKAVWKEIDYLKREAVMPEELHKKLRGLATKDELQGLVSKDKIRGLITKDEFRRVTTDEVHKKVTEALIPTEKKLASLTLEDASLNQKIESVETLTQKHCEAIQGKEQEQSSRFGRLDTSLNTLQMQLNRLELTTQEQKKDYAAVEVDLLAQHKVLADLRACISPDPSNNAHNLDKIVMGNSDQIQSLHKDCEKLNEMIRKIQDRQAASELESSLQAPNPSVNAGTKFEEEVELIRSDLDALKADQEEFKLVRHELNALKTDQEQVGFIRTDLDCLIDEQKLKDAGVAQGFEALEESTKKQQEELAHLQTDLRVVKQSQASQIISNHPPTPPFASASMSPREPNQQKLQDLEIAVRNLAKTTQFLELFVNSQQVKFDGLTSDRVVQSMIHQMQQMYPQHPGNLSVWQKKVDSYLSGALKDRLASIDSQIAARVVAEARLQEMAQLTAETRRNCLAIINSMKQDIEGVDSMKREIEGLKDTASYNRSQGPSDYGNLVDRVATVETTYVKAIGDLRTTQTDLLRKVTHLQHREGIGPTRSTPGEPTISSRSSKSVEPTGSITDSCKNTNDSDGSDTPLSQRENRVVRQDTETRRSSDPNLKRKAAGSDDDDEEEARFTHARKIPKRRNVSGKNPL